MKSNKKPKFELWEVLLITLIGSLIMSISTGYVVYKKYSEKPINSSKYLEEFAESYNNIKNNYYDKVDEESLIDAAISGMLKYLGDPYTTYLNENSTNSLNESLKGTQEGIGIEIFLNNENNIEIQRILPDTPAEKIGLKAGDIITKINNIDMLDKTTTEAVEIIKNCKDDNITLEINRNDSIIEITTKRETIYIPAIKSNIHLINNKQIGYIYISKFSDSLFYQFNNELKKIEASHIDGLIIDLRDNSGGYLSEATDIAELFLEKDKIIYSLESKGTIEDTKDKTDEKRTYQVYVLMNRASASASEILAAALKDSYNATIVGEISYGKGKVQKTSQLTDGTMYKYTSAKWLRPNGECIDKVGIIPDLKVELSDEYFKEQIDENDNQLQMALHEISK